MIIVPLFITIMEVSIDTTSAGKNVLPCGKNVDSRHNDVMFGSRDKKLATTDAPFSAWTLSEVKLKEATGYGTKAM